MWRMFDHLQQISPGEPTSLAQGVKNFCLRNSGKGIVVLLSDLMDKEGYQPALRYLLAQSFDVYVVQILSQEELHPELQGDLKLVDAEDGDVAEITVSAPLLKKYEETLAAFVGGAREFCTRRGMSYILANNQTPIDDLVGRYLRQRGLVR